MRKLFTNKNKKGFAMAELLAVSIVLLFIFSILFSNYLPLLAEYETRLSYNDVTAQYAAHYIRKMYKEALEDTTQSEKLKTTINPDINSKGFFSALSKNNDSVCNQILEKDKSNCEKIIEQYGIEEIIITKYKLKDDTDTTTKYVKNNYEQKDGSLYNYIGYLPNYEKSIYTGNIAKDEGQQLYRLILKTKDFGYATTPILSDYKTPGSCFKGITNATGITITKYKYNEKNGCGDTVAINNRPIKIENDQGTGTITGVITAIGAGVFEGNQDESNLASKVTQVTLSEKVKSIGENAFKNSNLNSIFNLDKVDSIGNSAFESTKLESVTLTADNKYIGEKAFTNTETIKEVNLVDFPSGSTIGNYAFANNKKLETVSLPNANIYSSGTTLSVGLFERSGTGTNDGIEVKILGGMTNIGEEMFYLSKINSIDLGNVQTIGTKAFSQWDGAIKTGSSIEKLEIPDSVTQIGESSFDYLKINDQVSLGSNLEEIGNYAFRRSIKNSTVKIPSKVSKIGDGAFENKNDDDPGINILEFETTVLTTIGFDAFRANNIVSLKIPDSVEGIGIRAFSQNKKLSEITLPNNDKYTIIAPELFYNCPIEKLTIPNNIAQIGSKAFQASALTEVIIDWKMSNLSTISYDAFRGQANLSNFEIPQYVSTIGKNAFAETSKLINIDNYSKFDFITDKKGCKIFGYTTLTNCNITQEDDNSKIYFDFPGYARKTITNMGGVTNE